jgi:hypothetical protein
MTMYPNVFTAETHAAHFKKEWERSARNAQLRAEAGAAEKAETTEPRRGLSRLAGRLTDAVPVRRIIPRLRGTA